ncbi:MAG TPA: uroporphyrinogen-III C-methyltransferase [Puia sp.]|nr:uroporphyrinogen-III C-methyltransferase [Puia sp.]
MNSFESSSTELILIGAGPGDPELLTVKAWKAMGRADVILYDHLANPALLELAPAGCECICVGKEPYGLSTPQEVIHALIEEKSRRGGIIVRLKGGDPFIFGRGFEEVVVARELGMKVTYIPGITSMQTSGLTGIPLTHRAISDGIWMLTGTKQDGALSSDLRLAMKSRSTVVIYMGMKKLREIADAYLQEGLGEVPAAIIQHGSLPHQRMAVGVAAALPKMAEEYRLAHPAVIVIGEVVAVGRGGGYCVNNPSIPALNSFKNSW